MNKENLITAFSSFNSVAENLEKSYLKLQEQVSELNNKLSIANDKLKKELIEKNALFKALKTLLESLPSAVITVSSGKISMTNNLARSWFSSCVDIGEYWQDFYERCQETSVHGEVQWMSAERGLMRISIAKTTLSSSDFGNELFILHDVTELSFMRESLARRERLEAIGQMTAALAHQIRTPLSSVMVYAHHLKDSELLQDKKVSFLSSLQKGLYQIESLIRDMLIFVKGDKYLLELISLPKIIDEVLIATEKKSEEKFLNILVVNTINNTCYIHCHLSSFVSAIAILVENAIEASEPNQDIILHLKKENGRIEISVIDHGKGIPHAMLNRIFEPFCSMSKRGTGLGLSIVKMVAESHGGHVSVDSHVNQGSVFRIYIPFIQ